MISKTFETLTWSRPPKSPVMKVNEVHLWKLRLDLPLIRHLRETLSLSESLYAERMVSSEDRRRFISGCGQLRMLLSGYLDMEASELSLGYALSGEPLTLRMPHTLFFDWSRAEDLALVAVSAIHNVTLEFERICHRLPIDALADHFFQPEENWEVRTSPANERQHRFYRTWTGREAHLRAGGEDSLVRELTPAEGFAAAVAARGEDWKLRCWEC